MKRISALLVSVFLLAVIPVTVSAAGEVDMERSVSLGISFDFEDVKVQGACFDIYLISTMDNSGELTVTEEFSSYAGQIDIRGKNEEAWSELTDLINEKVLKDTTITPADSALTGADGIAEFPSKGKSLKKGLYLVKSTQLSQEGYLYETLPFMVLLPGRDHESDDWNYDVIISPKKERTSVSADYTVTKVWKDYGQKDKRPDSITIQLLCDGKVESEIKLPYNGKWTYTWENKDVSHEWSVKELGVKNYTSKITTEGREFVITNTLVNQKLPQTGQMNWPIPVMAVIGLFLFIFGWGQWNSQKKG